MTHRISALATATLLGALVASAPAGAQTAAGKMASAMPPAELTATSRPCFLKKPPCLAA